MTLAILLIGACDHASAQESLEDTWATIASKWTQRTDMPTARVIAGSAVVDGKIYVVGGRSVSSGISKNMEEYDPAADTWRRRALMPTSRQGARAATVDGIVYAIGGNTGFTEIPAVEAYDPTTDTWTRKTDMPTGRSVAATVAVDGKIYVIGGNGNGGVNFTFPTVEVYDPATDTWTRKADMPTARWSPAADVVDGKIYVFGGGRRYSANAFPPFDETPIVEVYDPATDTWSRASDMPRARFAHSATAVSGKIYIIGGADADVHPVPSEGFLMVDVYDPATDTWTTAADIPAGAPHHTAGVVDGKIYTFGRWMGPGEAVFPTVQEFTPAPEAKNLMAIGGQIQMSKSADLTQADIPTGFYNRIKELNGKDPAFIEFWTGQGNNNIAGEFTSDVLVLGYLVFPLGRSSGPIAVKKWELETITMANGDKLFFENAVTVDLTPPNAGSLSVKKTITGGTGKYENALGFTDGTGTEDDTGISLMYGGLISFSFVVLNVTDESPGGPWYADFSRDFIPTDGTQAAIVFSRDPACIRPVFNLLDSMDIPAVFECPFLLTGWEWWHEPFVDFPFKIEYTLENGSVPVYFVDLAELNSEIGDDQLTIGELEAFSSLRVGQATYIKNDVLNSNAPNSDGKGHGIVTAIGTLQDSGEFFYVHWQEEFIPAIGKNIFLDTVIKFFPGAN
jgi:N-acetylneuraminic acid mutarotase